MDNVSRFPGMQNMAISCSLVCLIILLACLLIFWVGLIERQVPPILVVSVLYLLAGELVDSSGRLF